MNKNNNMEFLMKKGLTGDKLVAAYEANPEAFDLPKSFIKNADKIKKVDFNDVLRRAENLLEEVTGGK